jgi:hypothetical protein
VLGEVLPVLEVELLLPALLGRTRGRVTLRRGVAKYRRTELLVHQDASLLLGHPGRNRGLEAIIDHLLGGGDLRRLRRGQRPLSAKHPRVERAAVIEGQDVQSFVVTVSHHDASLSFR